MIVVPTQAKRTAARRIVSSILCTALALCVETITVPATAYGLVASAASPGADFAPPGSVTEPRTAFWPFTSPRRAPLYESDPCNVKPHPAVARVIVPEGGVTSFGSGTLVDVRDQFGLVVTNWHVVRDSRGVVEVVFPDGFRSHARPLKVDSNWDLAALVVWRPPIGCGCSPRPRPPSG